MQLTWGQHCWSGLEFDLSFLLGYLVFIRPTCENLITCHTGFVLVVVFSGEGRESHGD